MVAQKTSMLTGIVVKDAVLKPGDHIFAYRLYRLYTHHGIYVGEGYVIHLTRGGVKKTSLDNFRREGNKLHSLHLYAYERPPLKDCLMRCKTSRTLADTKTSQEVINKAHELLQGKGFGKYNLIHNNCEHFATFCRTGIKASAQTAWACGCGRKIKKIKERVMKFLQMN